MAVRRYNPTLRRLLQQRPFPTSPQRRAEIPQRLLHPLGQPAPQTPCIKPLAQPTHRHRNQTGPVQGDPHLPGRLPHTGQELPRIPGILMPKGQTIRLVIRSAKRERTYYLQLSRRGVLLESSLEFVPICVDSVVWIGRFLVGVLASGLIDF